MAGVTCWSVRQNSGNNNWMMLLTLLLCWPATVSASSAVSLASSSFLAPSEVNTCDISEFRCPSKDGQGTLCLPMDRWCNGKDECDNRVDEPRSCTSQYSMNNFSSCSFEFCGYKTENVRCFKVIQLSFKVFALLGKRRQTDVCVLGAGGMENIVANSRRQWRVHCTLRRCEKVIDWW